VFYKLAALALRIRGQITPALSKGFYILYALKVQATSSLQQKMPFSTIYPFRSQKEDHHTTMLQIQALDVCSNCELDCNL